MITTVGVIVVMLFATIGLSGCSNIPSVFAWYDGWGREFGPTPLVMNAGETHIVTRAQFSFLDFEFERIELVVDNETHENVVSIQNNTITAVNNGRALIIAYIHEGRVTVDGQRFNRTWMFFLGEVRVLNKASMTPITTAQDLADMNDNLEGNFILMADIDLSEWGNWTPIGKLPREPFTGVFINSDAYVIRNLSINETVKTDSGQIAYYAGLFGRLQNAYIQGIILEDVNISLIGDKYADWPRTFVGGIAGFSGRSTIIDSSVSGSIVGNYSVGGIVGTLSTSEIINGKFEGNVEVIWHVANAAYAGGIAGGIYGFWGPDWRGRQGLIKDSRVIYSNINGHDTANVGGIVGISRAQEGVEEVINSTFTGVLKGHRTGDLIGFAPWRDL